MGTLYALSSRGMKEIPPLPDVPDEQRAAGDVSLRYEDISQDGRVMLLAMPQAIGEVWRRVLADRGVAVALREAGGEAGRGTLYPLSPRGMKECPPLPAVRDEQRAAGDVSLRYEDISQDGRVMLLAMPQAIGEVWRRVLDDRGVAVALRDAGIA